MKCDKNFKILHGKIAFTSSRVAMVVMEGASGGISSGVSVATADEESKVLEAVSVDPDEEEMLLVGLAMPESELLLPLTVGAVDGVVTA